VLLSDVTAWSNAPGNVVEKSLEEILKIRESAIAPGEVVGVATGLEGVPELPEAGVIGATVVELRENVIGKFSPFEPPETKLAASVRVLLLLASITTTSTTTSALALSMS